MPVHHIPTTVDYKPSPYELGRMFYRENRRYNPFAAGTPDHKSFQTGYWREQDIHLRRTQYHKG